MKDGNMTRLRDAIRTFVSERGWEGLNTPKNLAMSISIEAAELLEVFQWTPSSPEEEDLGEQKRREIQDEIADVLIYLVRLADKLDIDPVVAAEEKLVRNATRYPIR